jgi:hypothetical protein
MDSEKNYGKGFLPIETEIHEKLNWDYDLIVKCLNYLRIELPNILKIEKEKIEIFLASISNFFDQKYPVIGIRIKSDFVEEVKIDFFDIEEKIEIWIETNGGIEKLTEKSKNFKSISWEKLNELKEYYEKE